MKQYTRRGLNLSAFPFKVTYKIINKLILPTKKGKNTQKKLWWSTNVPVYIVFFFTFPTISAILYQYYTPARTCVNLFSGFIWFIWLEHPVLLFFKFQLTGHIYNNPLNLLLSQSIIVSVIMKWKSLLFFSFLLSLFLWNLFFSSWAS